MTLSPFEVERREFGGAAWGYKRGEVDGFLNEVRGTVVGLWQERSELREENERLTERVARFTALEEQLKNTLLLAQDSAEKATEQARREAELSLREAGQKAREIVHQAHEERARLETTLRDLQSAEQETRQRFRSLAAAVLSNLDNSEDGAGEASATLRAIVQPANTREMERIRSAQPSALDSRPGRDAELRPGKPSRRRTSESVAGDSPRIEPPPTFDMTASVPSRRGSSSADQPVVTGTTND